MWGMQELAAGKLTGVMKIVLTLFSSPLFGFVVGFVLHRSMRFLLRTARPSINRWLRHGQWVTAAGLAFAHGTNNAQKGMGII
jgi:PiT family inorganic phosphate transporter